VHKSARKYKNPLVTVGFLLFFVQRHAIRFLKSICF